MCRRDGHDKRRVADHERPDSVRDGKGDDVEPRVDLLGHLRKNRLSGGVTFIGERCDREAVIVVANIAAEEDHGAGTVVGDQSLDREAVQWLIGDLDQPNRAHRTIIDPDLQDGLGNRAKVVRVREVLAEIAAVQERGGNAAMATVVRTWRSAPRPAGASMLVTDRGEAIGSISGGCVEGAVFEVGQQVIADGIPRYETYGVTDDEAFAVGLTCGGVLEVFVERVDEQSWPELGGILHSAETHEPFSVATIVAGPHFVGRHLIVRADHTEGSLGTDRLDDTVREDVIGMLAAGRTGFLHYGPEGERLGDGLDVFVATLAPPAQMLVIGAIDFSAALVRVGKLLGYRVTVCDARPVFATAKRFPDADEIVVDWPHRWLAKQHVDARTVIAVLTHDPKFDVPALAVALRTDAGYVGAMGSRRTHDDRLTRLKEAGLTDDELARLHSPIGLDLGARTPEETAISIAAEIVQARWGGTGERLTATDGPIHPGAPR